MTHMGIESIHLLKVSFCYCKPRGRWQPVVVEVRANNSTRRLSRSFQVVSSILRGTKDFAELSSKKGLKNESFPTDQPGFDPLTSVIMNSSISSY